jgi:guanylate kinase
MKAEGIVFILSAPSGTGKTTVGKRVREKLPGLKFAVSHTTRIPREGEKDGVDYYFASGETFDQMVGRGEFLEWAQVHDHRYGTSHETVRKNTDQGNNILLELDVQGAETLRKSSYPGVYIFLLPPSVEELAVRLKKRGTEDDEIIRKRMENGKKEITKYTLYDFVLTNTDVEETVDALITIIRAESYRAERYQPTSADIQALLNSKGGD